MATNSNIVRLNIKQDCPVHSVIVYNDRAEVTRLLRSHFDRAGIYDVVIEGFSPCVDQTSFHINGGTGRTCTILEVSYQTHYDTPTTSDTEKNKIQQLQQDCDEIQMEINEHQQEIERLKKQRTWLDGRATKLMNTDEKIAETNVETMMQYLEFYHQMMTKIDNGINKEENVLKGLNIRRDALQAKLAEHGTVATANQRIERHEATIQIDVAKDNVDIALEVAYLINQCSWSPSYDVRVNVTEGENPSTQLTYYGIIVNKSQENWTDAQFALSSAKPSLGGIPPKLSTLKVQTRQYRNYSTSTFHSSLYSYEPSTSYQPKTSLNRRKQSADEEGDNPSGPINVLATQSTMTFFSANFHIPRRATIDADGKPHKLIIGVLDLQSAFTYTIVPKLSLHAYLKASTLNDSDKYLLAGPTSIFMNNNFITHTSIDNVCIGDTFDVPLGIDPSIKVEYKPVKKSDYTQGLISRYHYKTIRHETNVTNTKNHPVTIFVYDQYPVASDERVKITLVTPDLQRKENPSNRTVTLKENNNLEWKCVLTARSECQLPFEYTIEWPTSLTIDFD